MSAGNRFAPKNANKKFICTSSNNPSTGQPQLTCAELPAEPQSFNPRLTNTTRPVPSNIINKNLVEARSASACKQAIQEAGLKEKCSKYRITVDETTGKVRIFNCETESPVDLASLPDDFVQSWNGGVADEGARAFGKDSVLLSAANAADLALKYQTFIPNAPGDLLSTNESVTVVADAIYLTTQNSNTFGGLTGVSSNNLVVAIRRSDGVILWKKNFYEFSNAGVPNTDYTRGAPTVCGDNLYMLQSNVYGQFQSSRDPANPSVDLGFKFSGAFPVTGNGRKNCCAVCVNRHTGALVWVKRYGATANSWNDTDNFRNFGYECTVIPDFDVYGNGNKIPLVIAGVNYVGQYFWNGILTQARGSTLVSAGIQRRLRSYIDQGKLMFINGLDGSVITETAIGPRNLLTGEVINRPGDFGYDPMRDPFIPGKPSVQIRENVVSTPLYAQATYDYDINGGNWTCVTFNKDAAILGISEFEDTVPPFMDGLSAFNNVGTLVYLATGQTVAANPTYHEMNVRVNILWVPGYEGDLFTVPDGSSPSSQFSSSVLVGLRISKNLYSGHVLSEDDAYALRYTGPSSWAAPVAINHNCHGVPLEVYLGSGQGHKVPYDESLYFDSDSGYGPVPAGSNFIDRQQMISDAVTSGVIANVRNAENTYVQMCRTTADIAKTLISPRGKLYLFDSVIAFNLRPGHLGEIIWHEKNTGFDSWQLPQVPSALPNNGAGRSAAVANGFTQLSLFWEQPSGLDGDFGQRACLVKGHNGSRDKIVCATKQGLGIVYKLSNVSDGPSVPILTVCKYLGPTSTLGGANYGSAVNDTTLFTAQKNYSNDGHVPLPNSKNFYKPYGYCPRLNDFLPPSSPLVVWGLGKNYLSSMDIETGHINWEVLSADTPAAPGFTTPGTSRCGGISCSPGIVFVPSPSNHLNLFDASTGAYLRSLPGEAGNSWVGIAYNEIYAWVGRAFGGTGTQYLRVFHLP